MSARPTPEERPSAGVSASREARVITRGVDYLASRQQPDGGFPVCVSAAHQNGGEWQPDRTVFATSVIGLNLASGPAAQSGAMRSRAAEFLRREMHPPGVWRFWTGENDLGPAIPFDADDTACASMVLRDHGPLPSGTERALLANRSRSGLFYTWLVPHRGIVAPDPAFWRPALSGMRHPLRRWGFWRMTEADPDDIDAVVCANVLAFLGEREATRATAAHLAEVILSGRESTCDKWYHRPLAVHHAIARAAAGGVGGLAHLAGIATERICASFDPETGLFGDGCLDTALAVSALVDWGYSGWQTSRAAATLCAAQRADGSWPRESYYVGGPNQVTQWGGAELSTSFCLSALARCPETS